MSGKFDFANQPQRIAEHVIYNTRDYDHPENWHLRSWNQGSTLYYSVPSTAPDPTDNDSGTQDEDSGFVFGPQEQAWKPLAEKAFETWDDLIALDLVRTEAAFTDMTVAWSTATDAGGNYMAHNTDSVGEDEEFNQAQVWLNPGRSQFMTNTPRVGLAGYETLLHEIGHSLGLFHPGPYNASDPGPETWAEDARFIQDTRRYTIMSYFAPGVDGSTDNWGTASAMTPMVYDILAVQTKYGADPNTRTGNDVYGFSSTVIDAATGQIDPVYRFTAARPSVLSIYDASGVDTLNLSGSTTADRIDLTPGSYSSTAGLVANLGIAFSTWIENAVGGSGADTISGNAISNELEGGGGADSLYGAGGVDYAAYRRAGAGVLADLNLPNNNTGDAAGDAYSQIEGLIGSAFADTLRGDLGNSTLFGGGSHDILSGRDGVNELFGDGGNDTFLGGSGSDRMNGGAGFDIASYETSLGPVGTSLNVGGPGVPGLVGDAIGDWFELVEGLRGSPFNDTLSGNTAANRLIGGAGTDFLQGLDGNDTLEGNEDDDTLIGGAGADSMNGGDGVDTVDYALAGGAVRVVLALAFDGFGNPVFSGGQAAGDRFANVENVIGTSQADTIYGNALDNRFFAGDGLDQLAGGRGNDTYDIGSANNTAFGRVFDTVTEDADAGFDTVLMRGHVLVGGGFGASYTLGANVEALEAQGDGNFTLVGNTLDNRLIGSFGNDRLVAGDGADTLGAGPGADTLYGEFGNDTYILTDTYQTQFALAVWDQVLEPVGGGTDRVILVSSPHPVFPGSFVASYTLGAEIENGSVYDDRDFTLIGNTLANDLDGGNGDDRIVAGDGNDTLWGAQGADTLYGEFGDDSYFLTDVATPEAPPGGIAVEGWDLILEAAPGGTDTVFVERARRGTFFESWRSDHTLADFIENGVVTGTEAFTLTGNTLANRLTGNGAFNFLVGQDGADTIEGMGGADALNGGYGNDRLVGGSGNDTLDGSFDRDTLIGGTGADEFVFSVAPVTALFDVVADFDVAQDHLLIGLAAFDPGGTTGLVAGSLADHPGRFSANLSGLPTGAGLAQFVYESDLGRLWFDGDGEGGAARQIVAGFTGLPALEASHILLG